MQKGMSTKDWVELLRDAAQKAMDVPAAPARVRGAIKTRGNATASRASDSLAEIIERLLAQPASVRLEVVEELIKAEDVVALAVLRALAVESRDPNADVRWAIADGLGKVAHSEAVKLLEILARNDPDETVRACAIGTLGDRARAAYRAQVGEELATPRALVRTRGAVRTHGTSPIRQVSLEAQAILDLLYSLRDEEPSNYVKEMADVTLRQLGE